MDILNIRSQGFHRRELYVNTLSCPAFQPYLSSGVPLDQVHLPKITGFKLSLDGVAGTDYIGHRES